MRPLTCLLCLVIVSTTGPLAAADVIVDYTLDAGGDNSEPLNGLAARATFSISDDQLTILLENTSTGVPSGFETSDSLLVSLGMNLPDGLAILSGDAAVIGPGSVGLGRWFDRVGGDSVGEEWIWTNEFGGDLLVDSAQVISTSSGQGGGTVTRFDGGSGPVSGPFGGIAADPPIFSIPRRQRAVSDSIEFELTLTSSLTEAELAALANASIVEFGSDQRYLAVPEASAGVLALIGLLLLSRRR